jgi:hypothetical protein
MIAWKDEEPEIKISFKREFTKRQVAIKYDLTLRDYG